MASESPSNSNIARRLRTGDKSLICTVQYTLYAARLSIKTVILSTSIRSYALISHIVALSVCTDICIRSARDCSHWLGVRPGPPPFIPSARALTNPKPKMPTL